MTITKPKIRTSTRKATAEVVPAAPVLADVLAEARTAKAAAAPAAVVLEPEIMPTPPKLAPLVVTTPGLFGGMSNEDYHADPVPAGSLSSSGARALLAKTPAHFKWDREHRVNKDVFDFGTAAHALVLEDDKSQLEVLDFADWRTKASQEAKAEAYAAGLTPILAQDFKQVEAMALQIKHHPEAQFLLRDGKAEQSGFYQHPDTGVWLRVRYDWLPNHRGPGLIISDYKTAVSADPNAFRRHAFDFGYHQQDPWYTDAAKALGLCDDPAFVFIVQEKTAPYLVNVIEFTPEAKAAGRALNEKAIRLFKECRDTDTWPGYTMPEPIGLPKYADYQIQDTLAS